MFKKIKALLNFFKENQIQLEINPYYFKEQWSKKKRGFKRFSKVCIVLLVIGLTGYNGYIQYKNYKGNSTKEIQVVKKQPALNKEVKTAGKSKPKAKKKDSVKKPKSNDNVTAKNTVPSITPKSPSTKENQGKKPTTKPKAPTKVVKCELTTDTLYPSYSSAQSRQTTLLNQGINSMIYKVSSGYCLRKL